MNNDKSVRKKRVLTQLDEVVLNHETGELIQHTRTQEVRVNSEPEFIKLYLRHVLSITEMPRGLTGILFEMLQFVNYLHEFVWNKGVRKRIADKLGCSESNVKKALVEFKKKEILFEKQGYSGIYILNPYLFGKGSWKNIHELRLTVDYTPERQVISGVVVNDSYLERKESNTLMIQERAELERDKVLENEMLKEIKNNIEADVFTQIDESCCPPKTKEKVKKVCGLTLPIPFDI